MGAVDLAVVAAALGLALVVGLVLALESLAELALGFVKVRRGGFFGGGFACLRGLGGRFRLGFRT